MIKQQFNSTEEDMNIITIWRKVKIIMTHLGNYRILLFTICIISGGIGYFRVQLSKPLFLANLTFSLEQGSNKGTISNIANQFGLSVNSSGEGMFSGDNLIELMKSRKMAQEVLLKRIIIDGKNMALVDCYIDSEPNLKKRWIEQGLFPMTAGLQLSREQDSALGFIYTQAIRESLTITKDKADLSFVKVSFCGRNEFFVLNFVNELTTSATDYYLETKMANSTANIAKLEQRVDSVSAELQAAMVGYASSQDQNSFTVQSTAKVPSVQKQMKVTMLTTLYGELVKNLELSKTMAAREEPLITVIDRPHYPLRVRESKLKSAAIGGVLGVFLTLVFLGARAFIQDLNKQAALLKPEA